MRTSIKRFIVILSIVFVPSAISSFFNAFALHGMWIYSLSKEALSQDYSIYKTAIFLYKSYLSYIWWLLAVAAISIDIYFYALKGYKHSRLSFYALKVALAFGIMFFLTHIFFQEEFVTAFDAHQPGRINLKIYAWLFFISTLVCFPIVFAIHETHRKWILPKYLQEQKVKN